MNDTTELTTLLTLAESIQPLTEEERSSFASLWKPTSAGRKEILTSTGEKELYLYFVLEGVQRVYYFDDKEREATIVFTYAPSFGGVLDSMLTDTPSRYYYETLTPSRFLKANFKEVKKLSKSNPNINALIQKGMASALAGILERMTELQCFNSEDKFRNLLKRSPHILQLIPHKYIANYLGIDPTNFSKLMNKIKI